MKQKTARSHRHLICELLDSRHLFSTYILNGYQPSTPLTAHATITANGVSGIEDLSSEASTLNGKPVILNTDTVNLNGNQQSESDYDTFSSKTGFQRIDEDLVYPNSNELDTQSPDGIPVLPAKLETGRSTFYPAVPLKIDYTTEKGEFIGTGEVTITLTVVGTERVDGEFIYPDALKIIRHRVRSYTAKTKDGDSLSVQEDATFNEWYVLGLGVVQANSQFNETATADGTTKKSNETDTFELTDSSLIQFSAHTSSKNSVKLTANDQNDRIDILPDGKKKNVLTLVDGVGKEFSSNVKHISVYGAGGDDVITIESGVPAAYIDGGAGNDSITGGDGNDTISGGAGKNTLYGGNGDDRLNGSGGRDQISGQAGNDRLYGNAGDDILDGGGGIDHLYGGDGNDSLLGGSSDDKLYGENDNDTLLGQAGSDLLDGGTGINSALSDSGDTLLNIQNHLM